MNGRLALFRNFDEHGNPLARPHTLLIDSEQLDSGEALDKNFRAAAGDEIERFRREIVARTGDRKQAEHRWTPYWVPGVNNLGTYGRWAFAELTDVYAMEEDFEGAMEAEFRALVEPGL